MEKNNSLRIICFLLLLLFAGCKENKTNYFPDPQDPGLAIFSNTGNNLMTCFVNGLAWRTINRISYSMSVTSYELRIEKKITGGLVDTLHINWQGYYTADELIKGYIDVALAVPGDFTFSNFSQFEGRRFDIDSTTNGFFTANTGQPGMEIAKGNGTIYFNSCQLDSIAPGVYSGRIAGLFEINFPPFNITRGRFDGRLENGNVQLW